MKDYRKIVTLTAPRVYTLMEQGVSAIKKGANVLKFQLDLLEHRERKDGLRVLFMTWPDIPFIIEYRHPEEIRTSNGYQGSEKDRLETLERAARYLSDASRKKDFVSVDHRHPVSKLAVHGLDRIFYDRCPAFVLSTERLA